MLAGGVLLLALAAALLLGWRLWQQGRQPVTLPEAAPPLAGLRLDENAEAYTETPRDATPELSGIKVPGYDTLHLPAGETELGLTLPNPEDNPCYFSFELLLADTGESLYSSRLVAPGSCLGSVSLSRPLEAGTHTLIIKIRSYSLEDQTEMNGAEVATQLEVLT